MKNLNAKTKLSGINTQTQKVNSLDMII